MNSVAYKLWFGMMLLILFVLILLWLFQIVFLESFYINQRVGEVSKRAQSIAENISVYDADEIEKKLDALVYDLNCYVDLVDYNGRIIYSNGATRQTPGISQNYLRAEVFKEVSSGEIVVTNFIHPRLNTNYYLIGIPTNDISSENGALLISIPVAPIKDTVGIIKKQIVYISLILFFISMILSLVISRRLIKPILNITKTASEMAEGNLSVRAKVKAKDEIGRLASALNHLGEELTKIESLRREFIANVSHELRTPLSLIRGFAETIKDVTGDNKDKREKELDVIIEETERLSNIVNDILDLSQIQSGKMALYPTDFKLINLVMDVTAKYELICEKMDIKLIVEISPDIIASGDEQRISQVIHNLLSNAVKHSNSGESIYIRSTCNDSRVIVEIADTGEVIPQEELAHVWDRFYKTTKSKELEKKGTGLGLAIVKSIIEAHNNRYGVNTKDSGETVFWFELDCR